MARVVQLSIPLEALADVHEVLSNSSVIDSYEVTKSTRMSARQLGQCEERARISFKLRNLNLAQTIKELKEVGVGELYGQIDVLPLACTTQALAQDQHRLHSMLSLCPSFLNRYSTLEIHHGIVDASHMGFDHVCLIVCASFIAAVGLLCDQIVAILASFFISPLMQMIIATTWGLVIGDRRLVWRGLKNMAVGASLCVLTGAAIGAVLCAHPDYRHDFDRMYHGEGVYYAISINSVQITSRGPPAVPNLLSSLIVAIFSGVAIALGFASGISSALSGVALSASLLPPVVNCGLMLVMGFIYPDMRCGPVKPNDQFTLHQVMWVSISLYAVNVACVIVFAYITFKLKRIGGKSLRDQAGARCRASLNDSGYISFSTAKARTPLLTPSAVAEPRMSDPELGQVNLG